MKKRTRWILIVVGVILGLVVMSLMLPDPGLEVETAQVERQTLQVAVTEEGQTRVRDRYVVAAPTAGRLERIALDEGDVLAQDDLVARLYPLPEDSRTAQIARARVAAAEAHQRQVEAQVEEARVQVEQAERDVQRSRELVQDSILSRQEFEQTELAVASARQRLAAAQATLRVAEADVVAARAALIGTHPQGMDGEAVLVRAPGAGRVLRVWEKSERVVQPGTPLVEIGDAGGLEVVVDVLSEDAVRIRPGHSAFFEEWGGDSTLHGRVRLVEPDAFTEISTLGVEEQRVNVIADLFDAPPELGSGYRLEAHLVIWTGDAVLGVPTSALFQQEGAWHVFAVEDETAVLRPVRIGHRSAERAEVLDGLDEGEEVILFPSDQVQEGVKVQ